MKIKFNFRFKNRKIKFREADYVEKHYIKDGKAIIPIHLDSIDELYMKHDQKKLSLSDDVCAYIEEIAYIIPLKYPIVLEFYCPELDESQQLRVKKIVKNNYGMDIDDRDYDIHVTNKKCVSLFLLGLVLFLLYFALENKIAEFLVEFLSIAGWVAWWEMFECLMLNNAEIRTKRLYKLQLYDSEIRFAFPKKSDN